MCFKSKMLRCDIILPEQLQPKWDHDRHRRGVDVAWVDASGQAAGAQFMFCPATNRCRCKLRPG
jgi:hypothetical protein